MEKFIGYCILLGLELWFLTSLCSGFEDNQEEKENDHKGLIMGVILIKTTPHTRDFSRE